MISTVCAHLCSKCPSTDHQLIFLDFVYEPDREVLWGGICIFLQPKVKNDYKISCFNWEWRRAMSHFLPAWPHSSCADGHSASAHQNRP